MYEMTEKPAIALIPHGSCISLHHPAKALGWLSAVKIILLQGQTPSEIAGLARAMREKCVPVFAGNDVLDIVGTGGDGIGSVNISTGNQFPNGS